MHINYAANQLSSSGARSAACCQLDFCSLLAGVKRFFTAHSALLPSMMQHWPFPTWQGHGMVLTWSFAPLCQAPAVLSSAKTPAQHTAGSSQPKNNPRLDQADRQHPTLARCDRGSQQPRRVLLHWNCREQAQESCWRPVRNKCPALQQPPGSGSATGASSRPEHLGDKRTLKGRGGLQRGPSDCTPLCQASAR